MPWTKNFPSSMQWIQLHIGLFRFSQWNIKTIWIFILTKTVYMHCMHLIARAVAKNDANETDAPSKQTWKGPLKFHALKTHKTHENGWCVKKPVYCYLLYVARSLL